MFLFFAFSSYKITAKLEINQQQQKSDSKVKAKTKEKKCGWFFTRVARRYFFLRNCYLRKSPTMFQVTKYFIFDN